MQTRINKRMVELGLAESRRKADELIIGGKLKLNGETYTKLGGLVGPSDKLEVVGKTAQTREDIYIAYNKPRGLVCSHSGQGSKTIFDDLPKAFAVLKIAGRLDKDSEGLVILSSDGSFIQQISHPSKTKTKTYIVETQQDISPTDIGRLNSGIKLEDGVSQLKVKSISPRAIRVYMQEGKNRQIRRTLQAIDKKVVRLERLQIGSYTNKSLRPGDFVFIKPEEAL